MIVNRNKTLIHSALIAIVIALLFPALWVGVLGESSRTPVVEKSFFNGMSESQRQEWINNNSKPEGFIEHIFGLPQFITNHWRGYLEASVTIFILVFVLSNAAFLGRSKNKL